MVPCSISVPTAKRTLSPAWHWARKVSVRLCTCVLGVPRTRESRRYGTRTSVPSSVTTWAYVRPFLATYPATARCPSGKVTRSATCTCDPSARRLCSIRDSQAQGQQRARWVIHRPASMAPQRYIISANGHTPPPVHTPQRGGQPSQAAHAVDNHPWCTRRGRTSSVSSSSVMRHACWHGRRLGPQEHGSAGAES